jgi:hypothetical protein
MILGVVAIGCNPTVESDSAEPPFVPEKGTVFFDFFHGQTMISLTEASSPEHEGRKLKIVAGMGQRFDGRFELVAARPIDSHTPTKATCLFTTPGAEPYLNCTGTLIIENAPKWPSDSFQMLRVRIDGAVAPSDGSEPRVEIVGDLRVPVTGMT